MRPTINYLLFAFSVGFVLFYNTCVLKNHFVRASPSISTYPAILEPSVIPESTEADIKAIDFKIKNARYLIANNNTVQFDWSGIVFELNALQLLTTKEVTLSFLLRDCGNSYNVKLIDLSNNMVLKHVILQTTKKYINVKTKYDVKFSDFFNDIITKPTFISLVIQKRTEAYLGLVTFYGVSINSTEVKYVKSSELTSNNNNGAGDGMKLKNPLRMEFLGASVSCGFGAVNMSIPGIDCGDGNVLQEDIANSFVSLTANSFKNVVEYHALCWSGIGVVRGNFSSFFLRPLAAYPNLKWDFGLYVPDFVVINLGNNDLVGVPEPYNLYSAAYNGLLDLIFSVYLPYNKNLKVISMAGVLVGDSYGGYTEKIVKARPEYGTNLHWWSMAGKVNFNRAGCYGHPSVEIHQLMAESLVNFTSTLVPPPEYEKVKTDSTVVVKPKVSTAVGISGTNYFFFIWIIQVIVTVFFNLQRVQQ